MPQTVVSAQREAVSCSAYVGLRDSQTGNASGPPAVATPAARPARQKRGPRGHGSAEGVRETTTPVSPQRSATTPTKPPGTAQRLPRGLLARARFRRAAARPGADCESRQRPTGLSPSARAPRRRTATWLMTRQPGRAFGRSLRRKRVFRAAQRTGRSAAWHRPPTAAEAPNVNARLYQRSFGTRCATSAAAPC
jgi:hypothetical protein